MYSARGDDLLAVEYLVYAIDEEPEMRSSCRSALVLERARWQLRNDLGKLSEARSPGAVIAKWRTLQDLSLLSISYGFASDVSRRIECLKKMLGPRFWKRLKSS